jgi:hypothetical protein
VLWRTTSTKRASAAESLSACHAGRLAEVQLLGHRHEGGQVSQIDAHTVSII